MWALGITLYVLVYWKVPFDQENVPALFQSIIDDDIEYPSQPTISPNLKELFSKILEKDPEERISMADLKKHPFLT